MPPLKSPLSLLVQSFSQLAKRMAASGPLLLASAAGLAATAVIGKSRTKRDAHHLSDVLVGSCLGFGVAYAVSKLEKPVENEVKRLTETH